MAGSSEIKAAVLIDRRPSDVFARLTNFSTWPEWQVGVKKTERISIGPLRIGSKIRLIGQGGETQLEITQIMPNELFAVRGSNRRMSWESRFALEAFQGGTWLRQTSRVEGRGVLGRIAAFGSRSRLKQNLARFKRALAAG